MSAHAGIYTSYSCVDCDEDVLSEDIPTHKEFCDAKTQGIIFDVCCTHSIVYTTRVLSVYTAITILLAK